MSTKDSKDFVIPKAHAIPYGGGQESNLQKCINNNNGKKMNPFLYAL